MKTECPFCALIESEDKARVVTASDLAIAVKDGFPITDGHTLIIPKRHTASFFDTTEEERRELLALIDESKTLIDSELSPDAYNIGINNGPAAGQTIDHLHIHLIPRYRDDVADPRGGVRWIVPGKANYWSDSK